MPYILFYSTLFLLFPSPTLSPGRRHRTCVGADDLFRSHIGSAFHSSEQKFQYFIWKSPALCPYFCLKLLLLSGMQRQGGCRALLLLRSFPEFSGCCGISPSSVQQCDKTWDKPCQCHQPWLCLWFIHCGIHQDLPVNNPFLCPWVMEFLPGE